MLLKHSVPFWILHEKLFFISECLWCIPGWIIACREPIQLTSLLTVKSQNSELKKCVRFKLKSLSDYNTVNVINLLVIVLVSTSKALFSSESSQLNTVLGYTEYLVIQVAEEGGDFGRCVKYWILVFCRLFVGFVCSFVITRNLNNC